MNTMRPSTVRAFSLVEMIAVVSIIALLLALTGIGANAWINSAKVTGTKTTMNTLKTAIDAFVDERPIEIRDIVPQDVSNPPIRYTDWFGHLPPCPTTPWKPEPEHLSPPFGEWDSKTAGQFDHLIWRYFWGKNTPLPKTGAVRTIVPPEKDYPSIECLVLFLTQCSPRAKSIIEKLPADSRTNLDKDSAIMTDPAVLGTTRRVELSEITDAWDQPLRWAVMPHDQINPANRGLPPRWELRSAGKDGIFAPPFSAPEQFDDVVLQGP